GSALTPPFWDLLGSNHKRTYEDLINCTAEISRYAVSKSFRRREGEGFYADESFFSLPRQEARRLAPHITLGLMQGAARLAADHGITHACAVMEPALIRLLERFGIFFESVCEPVRYHGLRVPCIAEV